MLQVTSSAWAQDASKTPSPKELWEAYPLEPGEAPPTATPSAEFSAAPSATATPTATPRVASSDDGGGMPLAVPIGLAALLAFGTGVGLGVHRRRGRPADEPSLGAAEPPPPPRFPRRSYPEPARPAPPPPPVPGARAPGFEDEREAQPAGANQREPH